MMKRLLHIRRAILDILSIWSFDLSFKQKSSFTYTLFLLKWKNWVNPQNEIINIAFKKYKLKAYNINALEYLFKEMFLYRVYQFPPLIKGDKILDAGANIGLATLYFYDLNSQVKIDAYEPAESSFYLLKKNTGFIGSSVQIHKMALSDFNGVLYEDSINELGSLGQTFSLAGNGAQTNCIRLSDVLEKENYDVVKLDVEGAEESILKDCFEKNIVQKVNCWFVEFHDALKKNFWIEKFEKNGFKYTKKEGVYCFWK